MIPVHVVPYARSPNNLDFGAAAATGLAAPPAEQLPTGRPSRPSWNLAAAAKAGLYGAMLAAAGPLAWGRRLSQVPAPAPAPEPATTYNSSYERPRGFQNSLLLNPPGCTPGSVNLPRSYFQDIDYVTTLPAALQSIYLGRVWRDPCGTAPSQPSPKTLILPYTFDDAALDSEPFDDNLPASATNLRPLPGFLRPSARKAMQQISAVANLAFREVTDGTISNSILRFRLDASDSEFYAYARTSVRSGSVVSYLRGGPPPENYTEDSSTMRHELMHALGFCHPFAGCATGITLPIGAFVDSDVSSILSYTESCRRGESGIRFGNVDLTALVTAYGASLLPVRKNIVDIDASYGQTSLLEPPGATTLRATSSSPMVLSLATDASAASRFGNQSFLLAPSSNLTNAMMQTPYGGYLLGNAADNQLQGSAGDDIIDGGGGQDTIKVGGGNNVVLVRGDGRQLVVEDFVPGRDVIGLVGMQAPVVRDGSRQTDGRSEIKLEFAGGEQVALRVAAGRTFVLSRDVVNHAELPDLSWCADDADLFIQAPAPGPLAVSPVAGAQIIITGPGPGSAAAAAAAAAPASTAGDRTRHDDLIKAGVITACVVGTGASAIIFYYACRKRPKV